MSDDYNVDGEQFRVVVRGELAATFTAVVAAADCFYASSCEFCLTSGNRDYCDVQTWTRIQ